MSEDLSSGDDVARVRADKARPLAEVAAVAADHGIRALVAGGPIFVAHGLISPRVSRAAAVVIDPAAVSEFVGAMFDAGWQLAPARRAHFLPSVILSLVSEEWAVELHVYTTFPGFYATPARVFDVLWQRRQPMTLNRTEIFAVDRLVTIMLATHDRLGVQSWSPRAHSNEGYLIEQFSGALGAAERTELQRLVNELRAVEPMRPLLAALGLDPGDILLPDEGYALWRLALQKASPATLTILALCECPPQRRLRQSLQMLRESPGVFLRAVIGWPRALVLIGGARGRFRAQHTALEALGQRD